jgi:uncharacterized protein with HEPN domain
MSKRQPKLLIDDMLESAHKILEYTSGLNFEGFIGDNKTVDAVIRNFEIIGEAANRLPDDFIANNSFIDWQQIRGFRNRIVHDYFGIDYAIVWQIKETFLKELIFKLEQMP